MAKMISIAIAVHDYANRRHNIDKLIKLAQADDRVSEIVLSFEPGDFILDLNQPKLKVWINPMQLGGYKNKIAALSHCANEWSILFDSDNIMDQNFVDILYALPAWNPLHAYQPEFSRPRFDYRHLTNMYFDRKNVKANLEVRAFLTMLNTGNYFVHVNTYLAANQASDYDPVVDTIFANYNLLKAGCTIEIIQNLQYEHIDHAGSYYRTSCAKYSSQWIKAREQEIVNLIKEL
jgi:hypothetical protein